MNEKPDRGLPILVTLSDGISGFLLEEIADAIALPPHKLLQWLIDSGQPYVVSHLGVFLSEAVIEWLADNANQSAAYRGFDPDALIEKLKSNQFDSVNEE